MKKMTKSRRYFVSYSYGSKFGNSVFGNATFTKSGINFDFQGEIEKKNPDMKNVVILFFTELKFWEFEDAK